MTIEFNTSEFQFSHGHTPKGRGSWVFKINDEMFWARDPQGCMSMTYGEAKKLARARAKAVGASFVIVGS